MFDDYSNNGINNAIKNGIKNSIKNSLKQTLKKSNNLVQSILNFIRHMYFLSQIAFIFFVEISKYSIFRDYSLSIGNLAKKLSEKNILYVKIFQAFALNNHFVDDTLNNTLIKFTDQAPFRNEDIDRDMLYLFENDYDITVLNDYKPINAGMISLVFQAERNKTKELLIVKMKRKNIEEKLKEGIANLLFFLQMINAVPLINNYGLPDIIQKNIGLLSAQTDFLCEVQNMQRFKTMCANLSYIVIPRVYADITTQYPSIILMDYLQGSTLSQIAKKDYEIYAKRVLQFFYISIFLYGVMHGDLHLGNILFMNDEKGGAAGASAGASAGKIGILDFGIVYDIGKTQQDLFDILSFLFSCPAEETAHKILQSGLIEPAELIKQLPKEHYQAMIKVYSRFINESVYIHKKIQHVNFYNFLNELKIYIHDQHLDSALILRPSADLLKIQVMFSMLHGIILTLCVDKSYIEFGNQVLRETFHLDLLAEAEDN
jgi:predicted unusual protein kinase regulating ubiquinone biosynthesis (AarF/ABC1/UbiB family)